MLDLERTLVVYPRRSVQFFVDFADPAVNGRIVAAAIGRFDQHPRGVQVGRTRSTAGDEQQGDEKDGQESQISACDWFRAQVALAILYHKRDRGRKLRGLKAPHYASCRRGNRGQLMEGPLRAFQQLAIVAAFDFLADQHHVVIAVVACLCRLLMMQDSGKMPSPRW